MQHDQMIKRYNDLQKAGSRVLKSRRWYEIKKILSPELLKEALSEDITNTLFPKSLSQKYNYVRKILYQ